MPRPARPLLYASTVMCALLLLASLADPGLGPEEAFDPGRGEDLHLAPRGAGDQGDPPPDVHPRPADAPPEGTRPRVRNAPRPAWTRWLPTVTVAGSARVSPAGRDVRLMASAEIPLPTSSHADTGQPPQPAPQPDVPPDPDAPCLAELRARAVARALVEPARARSYIERARRTAWLPHLGLSVSRRLGRREALDVPRGGATGAAPLGIDTSDDVRYEARATWELGRLVFSTEELAAEAQALRMADTRRDIEALVHRLYFERRRLAAESRLDPGPDPAMDLRRQVRREELEAELEALAGGTFDRCRFLPTPTPSP